MDEYDLAKLAAAQAAFSASTAIVVQALQGINRIAEGLEQPPQIYARIEKTLLDLESALRHPENVDSLTFQREVSMQLHVLKMIVGVAQHSDPRSTFDDVSNEFGDLTKLLVPRKDS